MEDLDHITIQRAAKGDKKAFKTLYDYYSPFIWRVIFKMLSGDQDLAKELLQETFVKIHGSLKNFRAEASFATWTYRIAFNVVIKNVSLRKNNKKNETYEDQFSGNSRSNDYDDRELIRKVLKNLTREEIFLLVSKELDGFSYDELAEITGQTPMALRTKMHRLKGELRERVDKLLIGANSYVQ